MATIADEIESYIISAIELNDNNWVEIKRSHLSYRFACVPSQINYVLKTRFSPERGFLVQSKRGGGGYLRIEKLTNDDESAFLRQLIEECGNRSVSLRVATGLVERLVEEDFLTGREGLLVKNMVHHNVLAGAVEVQDEVRALLLKSVLLTLLREEFQNC